MKRLMSIAVCVALLAPLMGCDELLYFTIKLSNTGTVDIVGFYIAPTGQDYGANLLPVATLEPGQYVLLEELPRFSEYDARMVFDVWDAGAGELFAREMQANASPPPRYPYATWYGSCADIYNYSLGYSWSWTDYQGEVEVVP